jgi:thioredoxin 1
LQLQHVSQNFTSSLATIEVLTRINIDSEGYLMSKVEKRKVIDVDNLDAVLKVKGRAFVLFYASWCHFSQQFLPIFERYAASEAQNCTCAKVDGNEGLCDKYLVESYPTVILFENGKILKRADAAPGKGLTEKQLLDLINSH